MNLHIKLTCVNSYNTNYYIRIRTDLQLADIAKITSKFQKKGFPLRPMNTGMCTFSTKKLRH